VRRRRRREEPRSRRRDVDGHLAARGSKVPGADDLRVIDSEAVVGWSLAVVRDQDTLGLDRPRAAQNLRGLDAVNAPQASGGRDDEGYSPVEQELLVLGVSGQAAAPPIGLGGGGVGPALPVAAGLPKAALSAADVAGAVAATAVLPAAVGAAVAAAAAADAALGAVVVVAAVVAAAPTDAAGAVAAAVSGATCASAPTGGIGGTTITAATPLTSGTASLAVVACPAAPASAPTAPSIFGTAVMTRSPASASRLTQMCYICCCPCTTSPVRRL